MKLLIVRQSQLNTSVSQSVLESSVPNKPHHEMCAHISNIVTKVLLSKLFFFSNRSSFKTEESQGESINLLVSLQLSVRIYKDYKNDSFSEIHGYFNCLQAISL